jgi:hypothetical protein
MGQQNGIDIFGGNSPGAPTHWQRVRIGGALAATAREALKKRLIAIFSNSGNFTTTIATYLRMAGGAPRRSSPAARTSTFISRR